MDSYIHGDLPISMKMKGKHEMAADFVCNVCRELAKDPVVTGCGHLFCRPCLHPWLQVHCKIYRECPSCKGMVHETSIVPIYGRGGSEGGTKKKTKSEGFKVHPPGNSIEIVSPRRAVQIGIRHLRLEGRIEEHLNVDSVTSSLEAMQKTNQGSSVKSEVAANFECNVCGEVAKDPVVTCCGHLFCWPCLYRWLYLHCKTYKECPACKWKVNKSSIVPIYGRGDSEGDKEKKRKREGLKVPPRPQGNRVESFRQQRQIMSPRRAIMQARRLLMEERLARHRLPLRSYESVGIASANNRREFGPVNSPSSGSSTVQRTNAAHVSDASAERSSDGRMRSTTGNIPRNSDAEDTSDAPQ